MGVGLRAQGLELELKVSICLAACLAVCQDCPASNSSFPFFGGRVLCLSSGPSLLGWLEQ